MCRILRQSPDKEQVAEEPEENARGGGHTIVIRFARPHSLARKIRTVSVCARAAWRNGYWSLCVGEADGDFLSSEIDSMRCSIGDFTEDCMCFLRDEIAVFSDDTIYTLDVEHDVVGDFESSLLPQTLDCADEIAGETLLSQSIRHVRVDTHNDASFSLYLFSVSPLVDDMDFFGCEEFIEDAERPVVSLFKLSAFPSSDHVLHTGSKARAGSASIDERDAFSEHPGIGKEGNGFDIQLLLEEEDILARESFQREESWRNGNVRRGKGLAEFYASLGPCAEPQGDDATKCARFLEKRVFFGGESAGIWPISEMDRVVLLRDEVPIDRFRNKGTEGCEEAHDGEEDVVERRERCALFLVVDLFSPSLPTTAVATAVAGEPPTRKADVPIRQSVDRCMELIARCGEIVPIEFLCHAVGDVLNFCANPLVKGVRGVGGCGGGIEVREVRVGHEEAVRVPEGEDDCAHGLFDELFREAQVLRADGWRLHHGEADRIRAVPFRERRGIRVVFEALAHLLSVCCKDNPIHNAVAEGRAFEESSGENHQSIEPPAGLIDAFCDEVGRESFLHRVRHRSRLEPTIEDIGNAAEGPSVAVFPGYSVHGLTVEIEFCLRLVVPEERARGGVQRVWLPRNLDGVFPREKMDDVLDGVYVGDEDDMRPTVTGEDIRKEGGDAHLHLRPHLHTGGLRDVRGIFGIECGVAARSTEERAFVEADGFSLIGAECALAQPLIDGDGNAGDLADDRGRLPRTGEGGGVDGGDFFRVKRQRRRGGLPLSLCRKARPRNLPLVYLPEISLALPVPQHRHLREALGAILHEIIAGADDDNIVTAAPDGQWCSPISLSADRPVPRAIEPLAEASVAQVRGHPLRFLVRREKVFFDLPDVHEPRTRRVIEERRVAPPAVGIAVADSFFGEHASFLFQIFHDFPVGLQRIVFWLHFPSCEVRHRVGEAAIHRDVLEEGWCHTERSRSAKRPLPYLVIVFPKPWRDVDDARAFVGRHKICSDDAEGTCFPLEVRKHRLIPLPHEFLRRERFADDLVVSPGEYPLHALLRDDVVIPLALHAHVLRPWLHGEELVPGECPRRRRPCEEIHPLPLKGEELHHHTEIRHFLISLRHLEITERSHAPWADVHWFMPFLNEFLFPELFEDPPDGFHVIGVHRPVVPVHVDPPSHALDRRPPFIRVPLHRRAAESIELRDAHRLDVLLPLDAMFLLDFVLDGEAVAIPPEAPLDMLSAHRLVARNHVLDGSREEVAVVGEACGERRAVIEAEYRTSTACADAPTEDVFLLPIRKDAALKRREGLLGINGIERHASGGTQWRV